MEIKINPTYKMLQKAKWKALVPPKAEAKEKKISVSPNIWWPKTLPLWSQHKYPPKRTTGESGLTTVSSSGSLCP